MTGCIIFYIKYYYIIIIILYYFYNIILKYYIIYIIFLFYFCYQWLLFISISLDSININLIDLRLEITVNSQFRQKLMIII